MGGQNRHSLSLRWVGMDDERIISKNPGCVCRIPAGARRSSSGGPVDLTPRRGLVYDALPDYFSSCTQPRRNVTWQVMH